MGPLTSIDAVFGRLVSFLGTLVGISIGLMAVSIPVDLAMRLLGWGNIPWLNEVIEYVLYAGVFLAAPWVLRQGGHVRVDLILSGLPTGASRLLEWVLNLFALAVSGVLIWFALQGAILAWINDSMQRKTLVVPDWFLLSIFIFGMSLVALEFIFRLVRRGGVPGETGEPATKQGF